MNAPDPLERTARTRPAATAVEWEGGRLTYAELDREVGALARSLSELADSGPGERPRAGVRAASTELPPRLAVVVGSRLDALLLIHAGPRAGFLAAILDPSLTELELAEALSGLDPGVVVCGTGESEVVKRAADRNGIRTTVVDSTSLIGRAREVAKAGDRRDLGGGREPSSETFPLPPEGPRYVVWTSGTSGRPRGTVLTGAAFEAVHGGAAERLRLHPGDRWITTLSPSHVGGLATVLRAASLESRLVVRDRFDPEELIELLALGRVTHAALVPVMLRRLMDGTGAEGAPDAPRCLLVGGAHAPEELVREAAEAGYPVALTYGMTESTSQAATATPDQVRVDPGSVGPPLSGVEIRIGVDGEILVRGPTLAAGYLVAGTDVGPAVAPLPLDSDGWLSTGDLGRMEADGRLRVTGRRSQRVVTGGVTVDPLEVESALRAIPGVADAAVVGVPDDEWGERVVAAIVLEGSHDDGEPVSALDRIRLEARVRLSPAKRPRSYRTLPSLPRNRMKKVDRAAVAALFEADREA